MHIVRKVLSTEFSKYRQHLLSLDLDSRTLRFAAPLSDSAINHLCDQFEKHADDHVLFCIENSNFEFVAVGHIALNPQMELALSVKKEYQGQGMGDALMKRCIQWCRTHNVYEGTMICLSYNTAIKHLCKKNGIYYVNEHGEAVADIHLDYPTISTFASERIDSNLAALDYLAKRSILPWKLLSN